MSLIGRLLDSDIGFELVENVCRCDTKYTPPRAFIRIIAAYSQLRLQLCSRFCSQTIVDHAKITISNRATYLFRTLVDYGVYPAKQRSRGRV